MKKMIMVAVLAAVGAGALPVRGEGEEGRVFTPIQLSVFRPLQLPFYDRNVYGLRLDLPFGYGANVYGIDLGLVNAAHGNVYGIELGAFNYSDGDVIGLQFGAAASVVTRSFAGIQAAPVLVNKGDVAGIQLALVNNDNAFSGIQVGALVNVVDNPSYGAQFSGIVNYSKSDFNGLAVSLFNLNESICGVQIGGFNVVSGEATGLQIGVMNGAKRLTGVQIGLLNLIENGPVPVLPVVNANF